MPRVVSKEEIRTILDKTSIRELLQTMEDGFVAYSTNHAVIPPVGHLAFTEPPGDIHIKYGYVKNDEFYVIKIASGFYENPRLGLSSSNGLMLIFSQKTGELFAILLDEGLLTDIRTAIAGAVCARYMAPDKFQRIGIVGTGIQARLQLKYLSNIVDVRDVIVWGRDYNHLKAYKNDMERLGWNIDTTTDIASLIDSCRLIVTCTPSQRPIVPAGLVKNGTHITAVGSDTAGKQELEDEIFAKADIILADSLSQCFDHGELYYAVKNNIINPDKVIEFGNFIRNKGKRKDDQQITVADLTGVAVQDIQIAKLIWDKLN